MSLITCPECNQSVSSKAPYCPHCGVAIAGNVKRCPKCGAYVLMNDDECPHCNAKFMTQSPASPAEKPATAPPAPAKPAAPTIKEGHNEATPTNANPAADTEVPKNGFVADIDDIDDNDLPKQPAPEKPKSHTPWYLLALVILALAIGGFYYWEMQNQQRTEEAAYLMLDGCKDPLNFEDFLAQYPNSQYADDVRARLKEIQTAKDEWDKAIEAGDVAHLRDFIKAHPDSPFRNQALTFIDSLDWNAATTKGSSAAYQAYIDQHSNGEHIDEAYAARDEAEKREQQAKRDSVARALARAALADSEAVGICR